MHARPEEEGGLGHVPRRGTRTSRSIVARTMRPVVAPPESSPAYYTSGRAPVGGGHGSEGLRSTPCLI